MPEWHCEERPRGGPTGPRGPLRDGSEFPDTLQAAHGVAFDVRSGICSAFPAEMAAAAYEVKVQGTDILLAL